MGRFGEKRREKGGKLGVGVLFGRFFKKRKGEEGKEREGSRGEKWRFFSSFSFLPKVGVK